MVRSVLPALKTVSTSSSTAQLRPQQQHQYQQTDKCTILKFDVVRKGTTQNLIATTAGSGSGETTLLIPGTVQIEPNTLIEQQILTTAADDNQHQQHHHQQEIISNQPIIVKIEPTQSFHIVDENDTRVLSLPLSDADGVGASWIDLKDIAGLQTTSATLVDVSYDSNSQICKSELNLSNTPPPSTTQTVTIVESLPNSMDEPPPLVMPSNSSSNGTTATIINTSNSKRQTILKRTASSESNATTASLTRSPLSLSERHSSASTPPQLQLHSNKQANSNSGNSGASSREHLPASNTSGAMTGE